jgi:phospholipid/cholesterol/gamma-HCH transport system ATP-binding protein
MASGNSPAAEASRHDATGSPPAVQFQYVSISFGDNSVLSDLSFAASSGEMIIILGVAGTGKSTLLKLANGLLRPDSGSICIFGKDINALPPAELFAFRSNIGMVFQEGALFDSLSVRENVAFRLREQHDDEEDIERKVKEALRFVELEGTIDKFPAELSGGMRRRVAIARAIITRPKLLLYDSPTGGLDPITSNTIIELIVKQRDVYESTALLVTHRLQDAFTLATHVFNRETNRMEPIAGGGVDEKTRLMLLRDDGIAFSGSLIELLQSKDPYIQEYLA